MTLRNAELRLTTPPRRTVQDRVRAFHDAFDLVIRDEPLTDGIEGQELQLRVRLIAEEVAEMLCAMLGVDHATALADVFVDELLKHAVRAPMPDVDVAHVARESADVLNVVYGTALHYGFDLDAAFAEVHESCMRKVGPDGQVRRRADGKVLKPEGWEPPNVARAIGLEEGGDDAAAGA